MSFFGSYLNAQVKQAHDGLVKTIVAFDPAGATEAQIGEYVSHVNELAAMVAKAQAQAQSDERAANDLSGRLKQHIQAATLLQQQTEAATDPAVKTRKETALASVLTAAEGLKQELADAKARAADSLQYAAERTHQHADAVAKMTAARGQLQQAVRDQERAKAELERASERKQESLRAAGIAGNLDTTTAAIDAMRKNAADMKQRAAAASLTSNALASATAGDSDAEAALHEAAGGTVAASSMSVTDRLAALQAGTT